MIVYCRFTSPRDYDRLEIVRSMVDALRTRGLRTVVAVNREAREHVRAHLGERETIYRLPEDEDAALERLIHLRRTHHHTNLLLCSPPPEATWLHKASRGFPFVALLDWGSRFMLYAHLIINPDPSARTQVDHYSAEARLMLGPKFAPFAQPEIREIRNIAQLLVDVGEDPDLLESILVALSRLAFRGRVAVLCRPTGALFADLGARSHRWEGIAPEPVHREHAPFPWRSYDLVITRARPDCLMLAGHLFATVALEKDQLGRSYVLEQLGVAPSLGWHAAITPERAFEVLEPLTDDLETRQRHLETGCRLIERGGPERIARAIPLEAKDRD